MVPLAQLALGKLLLAASPFAKSVEQGAATTVYCATAPELERRGGLYFRDCRERKMSRGAADPQIAARLWELSEQLTGLAAAQKAA